MPRLVIADTSKASIVMTSEVFKDRVPGIEVVVCSNGRECVDAVTAARPDAVVVDFDLPDADGISLVQNLRRIYNGPVFLTAYPEQTVGQAIADELFAFDDAGGWISKPVDIEKLNDKIDAFLLQHRRIGRRFELRIQAELLGKAAGRGKRTPKNHAELQNLSLGGALIKLAEPAKLKLQQDLQVAFSLSTDQLFQRKPAKVAAKKAAKGASKAKAKPVQPPKLQAPFKFPAKVVWVDKNHATIGVEFEPLSDSLKRGLEGFLRLLAFDRAGATSAESAAATKV